MKSILEEAYKLVNIERAEEYGDFNSISLKTIQMYSIWKGTTQVDNTKDFSMLMVFYKLARESYKHKEDNLIDVCGYIELISKI